jgi:hypothetical protein
MEQTRSWEAISRPASEDIPPSFMKLEGSLHCSQETAYPEPDESSP